MRQPNSPRPSTSSPAPDRAAAARGEESPLLWMHRRKDKSGETLIGPAAFAAGERLRADLTFAGMLPKVTMDWSAHGRIDRSTTEARLKPTEAAIAARQRVRQALDAVGHEFSGLLVDLCGFCKGLELIERERGWPARSGKVVAKLALAGLARHYGYDDAAMGRGRAATRAWVGERPRVTDAPFRGEA